MFIIRVLMQAAFEPSSSVRATTTRKSFLINLDWTLQTIVQVLKGGASERNLIKKFAAKSKTFAIYLIDDVPD